MLDSKSRRERKSIGIKKPKFDGNGLESNRNGERSEPIDGWDMVMSQNLKLNSEINFNNTLTTADDTTMIIVNKKDLVI